MSDLHKAFLAILLATITGSIAAVHYGYIGFADAMLTFLFVLIAWFAFGMPWEHRKWSPEEIEATWQRVAPKLCLTATVLAVAIPIMSLAIGCLITKYAPHRIDEAMARTVMQTPREIAITTFPRASSPEVSKYIAPRPGSYVAASSVTDIGISSAVPVLARALGEIDSNLRVLPASILAIVLFGGLFLLWIVEIPLEYRRTKKP